ncbi:hypothetical protein GR254_24705 [Mycobacterium tuberculosis]|nr:hypothetical protein [Mycobacterium tuberculosis]
MIQVCSQCGTGWNVRERQRVWCPRCRGMLLAPLADMSAEELELDDSD